MTNAVSIIVLAYNHQDFIGKNLESIFLQDFEGNIELIICNDASTDNTDEKIRQKIADAPANFKVKYFNHPKNLGATPNFYFALKQATGEFLAFCEGDDYWTDAAKLSVQLKLMYGNPDCALTFHQVINVSTHSEYDGKIFAEIQDREYSATEIYRHWIIHTASVVMRREVLESEAFKVTLRDADLLYFDTILFLAASTTGKLIGISRTMSAYRRHEQGISFSHNLNKDLRHNTLDQTIGEYHKGKIKNLADWQIFSRSRIGFRLALKKNDFMTVAKFLFWILKKYKILTIYIIKKWQH